MPLTKNTMKLDVYRYHDDGNRTLGILNVNGKFECYTIEDESRERKVMGETRIDEGTYRVALRTTGTHHARYIKKFAFHKGMLHILDVPNFMWILIHIGNTDRDTAGCLLVGSGVRKNSVVSSTVAYIAMYKKVIAAMDKGEEVNITYHDIEAK